MIREQDVEKAVDFLLTSAKKIGAARERQRRAEHMVKAIEALEFKRSSASSAEAKKADARASDAYQRALTEDAEATGAFEEMRALREAAMMRIEVWRTMSSNARSVKL